MLSKEHIITWYWCTTVCHTSKIYTSILARSTICVPIEKCYLANDLVVVNSQQNCRQQRQRKTAVVVRPPGASLPSWRSRGRRWGRPAEASRPQPGWCRTPARINGQERGNCKTRNERSWGLEGKFRVISSVYSENIWWFLSTITRRLFAALFAQHQCTSKY